MFVYSIDVRVMNGQLFVLPVFFCTILLFLLLQMY